MGAKKNKKTGSMTSTSSGKVAKQAVSDTARSGNLVKWLGVVLLIAGALYLDKYLWGAKGILVRSTVTTFTSFLYSVARFAAWALLLVLTLFIAASTSHGQRAWQNLKKARNEMYRVTWPTRQETMRNALILICIVIFMAILLWLIDYGFMELTRLFVQL